MFIIITKTRTLLYTEYCANHSTRRFQTLASTTNVNIANMSGIKIWGRLVFAYLVGLFWGLFVGVQVLKLLIFKRKQFFSKKNRLTPPDILQDKLYGEHKYAAISEVGTVQTVHPCH